MRSTVGKAGRVLELFTADRSEWGVSEAATELALPKSSAHDLLIALVDIGLLQKTSAGRYRLGWRIVALNRALVDGSDFRARAQRHMSRVADRFGRTMHLAALDSGQVLYLEKVEPPRAAPIAVSGVGLRQPAHCTAVGKVLLAYAGEPGVRAAVQRDALARRTRHTITTLDRLEEELAQVRDLGYAHDIEEGVRDLCCVAAPVRDAQGDVLAAVSISVAAHWFRQQPDRYRDIIIAAATEISGR
jgi:IclR family KDG regulon transcriptional repressor